MNSQLFNKEYIYPSIWDEEDKTRFKIYMKQSKELYPDMLEHFIELCCERQVNEDKGLVQPLDYSKVVDLEITTPMYEEFKTDASASASAIKEEQEITIEA